VYKDDDIIALDAHLDLHQEVPEVLLEGRDVLVQAEQPRDEHLHLGTGERERGHVKINHSFKTFSGGNLLYTRPGYYGPSVFVNGLFLAIIRAIYNFLSTQSFSGWINSLIQHFGK